jgi:hypothetical protein
VASVVSRFVFLQGTSARLLRCLAADVLAAAPQVT